MIKLNNKFKVFNSQCVVTIAMMVSVFLFSGFRSDNFQNSRQDVQIESTFDTPSNSEFQSFSFADINSGNSAFSLNIRSVYSLLQLIDFNSRLRSFIAQFSNTENQQEAVLFFLAKTIPLCSDEDSHLNSLG
jgi:hypothetical protein